MHSISAAAIALPGDHPGCLAIAKVPGFAAASYCKQHTVLLSHLTFPVRDDRAFDARARMTSVLLVATFARDGDLPCGTC